MGMAESEDTVRCTCIVLGLNCFAEQTGLA